MRRVDQLLRATAIAEARHFWFRGFRAFVTPLVKRAIVGRPDPLLLDCGCGTGANVELLSAFGRAFGFDLTEIGLRIGREAGRKRLRAPASRRPLSERDLRRRPSFDVLYALDSADRARRSPRVRVLKPGGFAIVNVAAMKMLRAIIRRSRRCIVLSGELRTGLERRLRSAEVDLHQCHAVRTLAVLSCCSAAGAPEGGRGAARHPGARGADQHDHDGCRRSKASGCAGSMPHSAARCSVRAEALR